MAHNEHIMPGGIWPRGIPPMPGRIKRMDQLSSESIDGDNGGTWNPAAQIVIGGSGVVLYGTGGIAGSVTTQAGAGGGGALVLGDSDYPSVASPHTRTQIIGLRDFFNRRDRINPEDHATGTNAFYPYDESQPGSIKSVATSLQAGAVRLVGPISPLRLIQGAVISSISLRMRVSAAPLGLPSSMPGFRVLRIGTDGSYSHTTSDLYFVPARANTAAYNVGDLVTPSAPNSKQFRCITAGTSGGSQPVAFGSASVGQSVSDGGVTWRCEAGPAHSYGQYCRLARPADALGYYAGGNAQDITMSNAYLQNTTIDLTQYSYVLEVLDEANAGGFVNAAAYHSLAITLSSVSQMRPTY